MGFSFLWLFIMNLTLYVYAYTSSAISANVCVTKVLCSMLMLENVSCFAKLKLGKG